MLPPPLSTVPSYNRLTSSSSPRPVSSVVSADSRPLRTRQQIYDEYLLECDEIEKVDSEHWERQGTIKYLVSDEEVEVILARTSVNAGHVAYATQEFGPSQASLS